ncbi:eukaryotic translation initiation factor 5B-like isoform X2 [Daphnia pulicaria]|uniref:eukaryotic translation initiation factor 5B-like isoform X2 n=1 Tax=Daphnia pulicaria TaxID=35523 RepID=UPI001EEB346F|nr:eukaryotic translation initiation factor 5B-like isoform X2 [Daphnia pulicaria]XP_046636185.1 eukaryotic translation initiation factor 5B-like isoform X2 [Daphnia pulicaria]
MSNTRLSTASSYSKNKAKKDLHPFYDSSASHQERKRRDASGDDELEDDFIGISPQVSHTNCYNENYFLDTQSKKQRMSISGQEKEAKLNKTGDWEHQLKGSFSRKPATTTRQIEKKTKPQSARNTEKATTTNPPSAKKRRTKNAERPSTETSDSPELAAKRPMVASERKAI